MTSAPLLKAIIANPMASDQEAAAFLAADEHWDGFAHYWRKLLPSNVYKVLEALLEHMRFNAKTWQHGAPPIPSHERLASESGISVRTVRRILARDDQGKLTYTYRNCVYHRASEESIAAYEAERERLAAAEPQATPWPVCSWRIGDLVAIKRDLAERLHLGACYELGDLMSRFIRGVERRRRYDEHQQRWVYTTNAYNVTPIMPLPPTTEGDLALAFKLHQVREQRAALTKQAEEVRAPLGRMNRPSCPVPYTAKLAEKDPTAPLSEFSKETTSISTLKARQRQLADDTATNGGLEPQTIRHASPQSAFQNQGQGNGSATKTAQIEQDRNRSELNTPAPRRSAAREGASAPSSLAAPHLVEASEAQRREWHDRRTQIDTIIGPDIQRMASLRGDTAPGATRGVLVSALAGADVPFERLGDALHLIDQRFNRVYGAGGKPIQTKPIAAWIAVARSVIAKGRSWGFDFAAQDEREAHEAKLRQDARAAAAHGTTSYIQTPGYYERLHRPAAPRTAANPLPDARAHGFVHQEAVSAGPPSTDPVEELQRRFRLRAMTPAGTPARPAGWEDDYYERTGLNRYRR